MTAAQQDMLTRVGPGTPMGTLLRRYWLPVAASVEVPPGGVKAVRVLGEEFALFRAASGEPALVDARCPHRGASLAHGIVEDGSLRCAYHGWRFGRDGACLETAWPALARLIHDYCGTRFDRPMADLELGFWQASIRTHAMPGARSALAEFQRLGIPVGVVSNTSFSEAVIRYELAKHGLTDSLAFVMVSAESQRCTCRSYCAPCGCQACG